MRLYPLFFMVGFVLAIFSIGQDTMEMAYLSIACAALGFAGKILDDNN